MKGIQGEVKRLVAGRKKKAISILQIYLSFHRRHIRSLGTLRRFEMVFFKLSILSSLLTLSSNWPPVVGATVREMMAGGGAGAAVDGCCSDDADVGRWPQRQVGEAAALLLLVASAVSRT